MKIAETNLNVIQHINFEKDRELLVDIYEGRQPVTRLADLLTRETTTAWSEAPGEASLAGAQVVYFGANSRRLPTLPKFKEVMTVKLSDKDTIKFAGKKLFFMLGLK